MDLRKRALRGLKWTISSAFIQAIIQLLKLGIITRLLSPEDFGLMAIVLLILGIGELFKDWGMSAAIIHKQDVSKNQLSSLYWLNVLMGFVLFLLIALLSPLFSVFFESPALLLLIPFSASSLFFQSFGQQYSVLFRKELQFNILESISLAIKVIDFIVVVSLALLDYGIWALVYTQISSSIINSSLLFFFGKRTHLPSLHLKASDIKPFFAFGLYQMGGQIMNYLNSNLDKIILGRFFGMEVLGFYNIAWQLIRFPLTKINPIINKISFPLFSKLQNQANLLQNYYSFSVRILTLLIVPLYLFMAVFAMDIVRVLFGENWGLSAYIIQILAGVGIMKTMANPGGSILLALGRADIGFWWNVFWLLAIASTLFIALNISNDVITLAYGLLIINCLGTLVWHYIIHTKGGINYRGICLTLLKSLLIAVICLVFIYMQLEKIDMHLSLFSTISMKAIVFLGLYITFIWFFEKKLLLKLRLLIQ